MADGWDELRRRAAARAQAIGIPQPRRSEDWRYVDVAPLAEPPTATAMAVDAAIIAAHRVPGMACLTLVDGAAAAEWSDRTGLGEVLVDDLLEASDADAYRARWLVEVDQADDCTACWTDADLRGAARVRARTSGCALQVLALATGQRSGGRVVVEVAANAELRLVVSHVALARSRAALAIEATVGRNGRLIVDELQYGQTAQCFPSLTLELARDAVATWTTVALGGELVRLRTRVALAELGAEASFAGVHALDGTRQAHTWLRIAHRVGATRSQQRYKTVADGSSRASFDGRILIAHGADGANAEQLNQNLLLSRQARVDTRPQLDILDDQVKASHGATIGQVSQDELFYLRARGLSPDQAQALLVRGFVDEIVAGFSDAGARARAQRLLAR